MEKRVFADRAEYLGDPAFVDIDMSELISDTYVKRRAMEVDPLQISQLEHVAPGLESPNTTHYSIIDGDGNAVSNTYTINWAYGSKLIPSELGFFLNNEMDDFSSKPEPFKYIWCGWKYGQRSPAWQANAFVHVPNITHQG